MTAPIGAWSNGHADGWADARTGGVSAQEAERLAAQAEDRGDEYVAGYWGGVADHRRYRADWS